MEASVTAPEFFRAGSGNTTIRWSSFVHYAGGPLEAVRWLELGGRAALHRDDFARITANAQLARVRAGDPYHWR